MSPTSVSDELSFTLGEVESNGGEQQEDKTYNIQDEAMPAEIVWALKLSVIACHPAQYASCQRHCVRQICVCMNSARP